MSITNISSSHLKDLMISLNQSENKLELLKSNHSQYAQLKLISNQMEMLKTQAKQILNEINIQNDLHSIHKNFQLISGNTYYLYSKNEHKFLSLISPEEWGNALTSKFEGKYFYDYDKQFNCIS